MNDVVDRTSVEVLEEEGEYIMKVRDSYMDPEKAREMAHEILEALEQSDCPLAVNTQESDGGDR